MLCGQMKNSQKCMIKLAGENLCTLLKSSLFAAAAYWFPVTMSNIALNTKNVGFPYGEFLLKCAFFSWLTIIKFTMLVK